MSTLNSRDKAILEKVLRMEQGWLLDFSDRTMQNFFSKTFKINIYDEKYDFDFPSKSKANRLRGIWLAEDDTKVGLIVSALVDYAEVIVLTKGEELTHLQKELFQKAKEIGLRLLTSQSVQKETKAETQKRRSNLFSRIKTQSQLSQNRELFQKVLQIVGEIEPHHKYTIPTNEENDDVIQLLIDLKLAEYDWSALDKQTHRAVGNRIIEFSFDANDILHLKNRVVGKNGRVKKEALDLISKDIASRYTLDEIVQAFCDAGVPESMFVHNADEYSSVFYVLSFYSTTGDEQEYDDLKQFRKILEKVLHPLAFGGDEDKAKETRAKYNSYLKYDKIELPINTRLLEKRHINRIKELYIYSVINLHKNTDGDYLCDDASKLLSQYNISRADYTIAIEKLEAQSIVVYEEKYYEDDRTEFSYDGRKVDHNKLAELIATYRGWLKYRDHIDLLTVKVLADEMRRFYKEEDLLEAVSILWDSVYIELQNNLEEMLYYFLSTKGEAHIRGGIEVLAKMFEIKYHNVDTLLKLEKGFFDSIATLFGEVLDVASYQEWYEMLPKYVKKAEKQVEDDLELYVTKSSTGFLYNGRKIENLSTDADYYKVFSILFELLPKGYGVVEYKVIEKKVRESIPKTKNIDTSKLRLFIQRNLTDQSNGFLHYAKITDPNLLKTVRGKGIEFNNKRQ